MSAAEGLGRHRDGVVARWSRAAYVARGVGFAAQGAAASRGRARAASAGLEPLADTAACGGGLGGSSGCARNAVPLAPAGLVPLGGVAEAAEPADGAVPPARQCCFAGAVSGHVFPRGQGASARTYVPSSVQAFSRVWTSMSRKWRQQPWPRGSRRCIWSWLQRDDPFGVSALWSPGWSCM